MDNWNNRSDVTDEIAINMRKKAIFSIFVQIFIHFRLFILTVTANFSLLAVKWSKFLVLAIMPTPPPAPTPSSSIFRCLANTQHW